MATPHHTPFVDLLVLGARGEWGGKWVLVGWAEGGRLGVGRWVGSSLVRAGREPDALSVGRGS